MHPSVSRKMFTVRSLTRTSCMREFVCVSEYLNHEQSLLLFSIAVQETVLRLLQPHLPVVQAGECLQRLVAPHNVQLEHCIVIHTGQQSGATAPGGYTHMGTHPYHCQGHTGRQKTRVQHPSYSLVPEGPVERLHTRVGISRWPWPHFGLDAL